MDQSDEHRMQMAEAAGMPVPKLLSCRERLDEAFINIDDKIAWLAPCKFERYVRNRSQGPVAGGIEGMRKFHAFMVSWSKIYLLSNWNQHPKLSGS